MKPKTPQTARFVVIATQYGQSDSGGMSDPMPRSSISPYRLTWTNSPRSCCGLRRPGRFTTR